MLNIFWGSDDRVNPKSNMDAFPDPNNMIYRHGTIVYFNGPIWSNSITKLIEISRQAIAITDPNQKKTYTLYINSPGGYINEMFRFTDFVETEVLPQVNIAGSVVQGMAASAATIIACVFPNRLMTRRSTFMIHEIWSGHASRYTPLKSYIKYLDDSMDNLVEIYARATGKKKEQIRKDLLKETYFTAQEAKKYGLVQKVV